MDDVLAELWEQHRGPALERVDVIEEAISALLAGRLDAEACGAARAAAHKIRGSAGTYGFPRASELAAELEELFADPDRLAGKHLPDLAGMALSLREQLEAERRPPAPGAGGDATPRVALAVSEDADLGRALTAAAERLGVPLETSTPGRAEERIGAGDVDLVLLDQGLDGAGAGVLSRLTSLASAPPVLVLSASGQMLDRVDAVRRGARGFLDRATDPDQLIAAIERFPGVRRRLLGRVIAVDDDPAVLSALTAILGKHGVEVEAVDDPLRFWSAIAASDPELAIVDLDMPGVDGIELCRTIRADPRYAQLPVLILTSYREADQIQRAFSAGADDYLWKPIIEEVLLERVRNRIERNHALHEASDRDSLTGLPARRALITELERLAAYAAGSGEPLTIAVLDLDGMAAFNSRQGLRAGDAALRRTAELLDDELAAHPLGRWDGDSFVVGLSGLEATEAVRRIATALERLTERGQTEPTLSAGLASAHGAEVELERLLDQAERALQGSRKPGRIAVAGGADDAERVDVVMVEDDDAVVDVLRVALGSLNLSTRRLADGAEAVAALAGDPPTLRPRIVLLDWDLPGLDGLSVLRRLAERGVLEHAGVMMLTARSSEAESVKALQLGAVDFVAKPFSVPVLIERLRRMLAR